MNGVKLEDRIKEVLKQSTRGNITGQDLKTIIEYQYRKYIPEESEPINNQEAALLICYSIEYN